MKGKSRTSWKKRQVEKRRVKLTKVIVIGEPVAKERARVVNGRAFTPKRTKAYEEQVAWEYKKQKGKFYDKEPVRVKIELYFTPPKKTSKRELTKIATGQVVYTGKKDIDNIAKSILDGLNGVAYIDDRQVVELKISKQYTLEKTRAEIELQEVG